MAAFIMAGPVQAIAFTTLCALLGLFLLPLELLSSAAIALVTLRLGGAKGLQIAVPSGLLFSGIVLLLLGRLSPALGLVFLQWLPVLLLALVLQQSASWRQVMVTTFGVSLLGIVLFHIVTGDPQAFWKPLLQPALELPMIKQQFQNLDADSLLESSSAIATGMFAALLTLGTLISLMLGRHWRAMLYNPGGFGQELRELRLPRMLGLGMVGLIGLVMFSQLPLLIDLIIVGLVMFMFQGLALIHELHHRMGLHIGWLIGFYTALVLLNIHLIILLAAFGIIDSIADFRNALRNKVK
ncbi:MAG: hypothetical protein R3E89_01550 [Thiolinea sp.]